MAEPAGILSTRAGVIKSAADSLKILIFGRGAHGSMPQASIDPIVMAAATVLRLQTIVSREVAPTDAAVVTIGSLQAGEKENVIPDEATIKLNLRTYDERSREHILAAIERIVRAQAAASGAIKPPEITALDRYSLVKNDPDATRRVVNAFRTSFLRILCAKQSRRWPARTLGLWSKVARSVGFLVRRRYRRLPASRAGG
jgi:hippurate hydrolase